ncbi:hypothetical protein ASPVEDRAFT_201776 [Aspergillus versicolor CBS 583.65]|uniref:Zn(2)-C6 fungal-type domain-containing protein n=1 Tax=Aspergillus versicolor CBS 583.65 TaxID=1036611 RepID=A0A1L9Q054_ASPVE|nr:uncharacterized protein ASPVEDRAFT_201776 [Aspergillus versicolor CBS 583.65]OJJ07148.1 hypothetical protein ASPVEDRAFT_201776 [Aspergillus versicolor CBS 583.65]
MDMSGVVPPVDSPRIPRQTRQRGMGRTACSRCKTRKQKCDGRLPACSSCTKSGAICDLQNVRGEDLVVAKYIQSLESKIAELELQLVRDQQSQSQPEQPQQETPRFPLQGRIGIGGVVNSLCSDLPERSSVSESLQFGVHLALNLGSSPNSTGDVHTQHGIAETPTAASPGEYPFIRSLANNAEGASPPSEELGAKLIDAYSERLEWRYPFLDLEEVRELHRDRERLSQAATQQFGLFKLYLVYAIGSGLLDLTEKRTSSPMPEAFYSAAMQHIPTARNTRSLENVEAMVLLALFHLRTFISQELWYLIGFAMRTCIHLGMYLARREAGLPAAVIQRRRKLFWTVYSLERNVSIALGYPVSLPDRLIDVELPVITGDRAQDDERLQQAIFIFQLRRIESRIHHSIYRNDRTLEQLLPKTSWHYQQLQQWKEGIVSSMGPNPDPQSSTNNDSNRLDYLLLHYHRAIRLLVQPFLSILPSSDPYYKACLESAGQICQLHKRLHQNSDYGHSFIAVQTVFVSGITLLYCLWIHGSDIWSIRLSNHLRACSSVLFVMGDRTPWVRRYRDAFEALVTVTMERLEVQQSSTDNSLSMQDTAVAPNAQMRDTLTGVSTQFPTMNECPPGDPMPMPPPLQVLQDRWMEFDTMAVVNELVNWTDPGMSGPTPYMDFGAYGGSSCDEWQLP